MDPVKETLTVTPEVEGMHLTNVLITGGSLQSDPKKHISLRPVLSWVKAV